MNPIEYAITTEFIELNQLLKLCGLAGSGGAGGALVSEGNVEVDGQVELRKRCKIRPGQVVRLGDALIRVTVADAETIAAKAAAHAAREEAKTSKPGRPSVSKRPPASGAPWGSKPQGKRPPSRQRRTASK